MRDAHVAAKTAGCETTVDDQRRASRCSRNAERTVRSHARSVGLSCLIVVRINVCDDVERPAGRDLDDRSDREVRQDLLPGTAASPA